MTADDLRRYVAAQIALPRSLPAVVSGEHAVWEAACHELRVARAQSYVAASITSGEALAAAMGDFERRMAATMVKINAAIKPTVDKLREVAENIGRMEGP